MDARLRALERDARAGHDGPWLRQRLRLGHVGWERLLLAAFLGSQGARSITGDMPRVPAPFDHPLPHTRRAAWAPWARCLVWLGDWHVVARVALAAARLGVDAWARLAPQDTTPRALLDLGCRWARTGHPEREEWSQLERGHPPPSDLLGRSVRSLTFRALCALNEGDRRAPLPTACALVEAVTSEAAGVCPVAEVLEALRCEVLPWALELDDPLGEEGR